MKNEIIEKTVLKPFELVYSELKENILSEGFLLLNEIDTQKIVSMHGVNIKQLKQLLFFHPKYIQKIINDDYLAINEIPIKLVVTELDKNKISISVPNPMKRLGGYKLENLGEELLNSINQILKI